MPQNQVTDYFIPSMAWEVQPLFICITQLFRTFSHQYMYGKTFSHVARKVLSHIEKSFFMYGKKLYPMPVHHYLH